MPIDHTTRDPSSAPVGKRWPTLCLVTDKLSLLSAVLLVSLPALLGAYLIKSYAVNVLFGDEWSLVRHFFSKWYVGTWTFADLWAQHNEHRIFFPRLLFIPLWYWTHLDTRAGMWATWVMLCLLAAVLYLLISPLAADRKSALLWFMPVSWLVFNWRQTQNLLLGVQIAYSLMALCLVCAIYLLAHSERLDRCYCLALGSAAVSSLSFANGLLIWPIGLLQILGQHYLNSERLTQRLRMRVGVWGLASVVVYTLYFRGYVKPGHFPGLLFSLQHPLAALQLFLVYWGNPLVGVIGGLYHALFAGAILLAMGGWTLAVLLRAQTLPRVALPLFSLVLFALLSGVTLMIARVGFGAEQAGESRYILFSSLGLIGSFALVQLVECEARRGLLQGMWVSLMLFGALTSYVHGREAARAWWVRTGEGAFFVRSYACQPDERLRQLRWGYGGVEGVRAVAPWLEQHHLNVFYRQPPIECHMGTDMTTLGGVFNSAPLTARQELTDYAVDVINKRPAGLAAAWTIDSSRELVVQLIGWAVDRAEGGPASGVYLNVDGQQDFPAEYGQERVDVALAFGQPAYGHSGFVASLPVEKLGVGQHRLRLKIIATNRRQYYWSEHTWIINIR